MLGNKPPLTDHEFMHGDQEDWDLDIIQALISPGTVEDAALACAAAWLNFLPADRVAVAIFSSSSRCIVAHGQRDDSGEVTIDVGLQSGQIAALLRPEDLFDEVGGPCQIDAPSDVISWPEYLSAVVARCEQPENDDHMGNHFEDRLELVKKLSRQLLSRWSPLGRPSANADHMESMAEFAAGAGHEINNPLGSIIGQSQLLLKRSESAEQKQALETIGAQAWRIRDMIGDTMLFARPPEPDFSDHDLIAIVKSAYEKSVDRFSAAPMRTRLRTPDDAVTVLADDSQVAALISHLIANACQAVQDLESADGDVTVTVSRLSEYAASITVDDNGHRMDEAVRRHLFDPFYSGRQAGRGLGFGLCHAWQIARMHNGMLLHEELEDGNRFRVILPVEADDTGS